MTVRQPHAERVEAILRADVHRWRLLAIVAQLSLPDCWIAAGFVRNAVWDARHDRPPQPFSDDVDVIWFNAANCDEKVDRDIEKELRAVDPAVRWSVKNQARMHQRNGDRPYSSAVDAMRFWPETATAVAARRVGDDECIIASSFGLDDLFTLTVRPAGRFRDEKRAIYEARIRSKRWFERWPRLSEE
ncbi:nucleotidyltransferase family protein [Erythrobacter sp.]|uniref:nucleotidyltransferase family protein n=1 Tax=Erythrobacter sp. TaxID=1042 RepID=UPI002E9FC2C9|nr:nucleotidyltransferase family protein [Erythrobacter sp.]